MATTYLVAPLALWATWLVWVALLTGVGLVVRIAITRTHELTGEALFASFWLGLAATTLLLLLLHFVVPITSWATLIVVAVGVAGLLIHAGAILRGLQRAGRVRVYSALGALALVGAWTGMHGIQEVAGFDTHMYLVPVVEWIKAHPIVPGLANLNERYGFNQGTLPLAAMLEGGPWTAGSSHLLNGIFVTAVLLRIAASLSGWPGRTRGDRARRFYDLIILTPVVALVAAPIQFRALDADIAASLAIFSGLSLAIAPLFDDEWRLDSILAAGLAFTLGSIFKLSTASVAVPLWLIVFGLTVRSPQTRRHIVPLIAASAILAVVWMVRGIVLSGYPLYPSHVLGIPFEWRVPREQAEASAAWVLYFAKTYYAPASYNNADVAVVCGSLSWIAPWFNWLTSSTSWWRIPLPVGIAAGLAILLALRGETRAALRPIAPVATAIALGGTVWFSLSPRPDFGITFSWSLAGIIAASAGAVTLNWPADRRRSRWLEMTCFAGGIFLCTLPLAGAVVHDLREYPERGVSDALEPLFPPAMPDTWLGVTQWEYPTIPYQTTSGLALFRPGFHRCSRGPINCTSHPAKNLRLREAGNLRRGFAVDGEWKVERYPNPNSDFLAIWRSARENGVCTPGLRTSSRPRNFRFERKFMET